MGRVFARLLAAAALIHGGCIVRNQLEAPSKSGTHWVEMKSAHFTLVSDLDPEPADGVLRTFEHVYTLLARVIFVADGTPEFQTRVIAFRSEGELREFLPPPFAASYAQQLPNDSEQLPTVIMSGLPSPSTRVLLAHELAHRFNHAAFRSMPIWLNEGLAQYYSTVRGDVAHPVVGELDPDNGFAAGSVRSDPNHVIYKGGLLTIGELPRPSALMGFDPPTFYAGALDDNTARRSWAAEETVSRNYATAWALVHMLMHGSASGRLLRHALTDPDGRDDLADALTDLSANRAKLDRELDVYLRTPIPWREHHEAAAPPVRVSATGDLDDVAVLALWNRIRLLRKPDRDNGVRNATTLP